MKENRKKIYEGTIEDLLGDFEMTDEDYMKWAQDISGNVDKIFAVLKDRDRLIKLNPSELDVSDLRDGHLEMDRHD